MPEIIKWLPVLLPVSEIKNWSENPRTINKEAYERLKERIKARGFHDIIKIDTNKVILSGNQRKRALEELGVERVYCLIPNRKLTEQERVEVAIESNRSDGNWDYDMLSSLQDPENLKALGFSDKELGIRLEDKVDEESLGLSENAEEMPKTEKMTFILSKPQARIVIEAIQLAKEYCELNDEDNNDKTGNALFRICDDYVNNK